MFEMLSVVTVLPILGIILLVLFFVFVVWPKIRNSKWGEDKFDEMTSDGYKMNSTSDLIDSIKSAKDGLTEKSKEAVKTIKDATAESKVINKALGKDKE